MGTADKLKNQVGLLELTNEEYYLAKPLPKLFDQNVAFKSTESSRGWEKVILGHRNLNLLPSGKMLAQRRACFSSSQPRLPSSHRVWRWARLLRLFLTL